MMEESTGMSMKDAESAADAWLHAKEQGILGISYWTAIKENNNWIIHGEAELARGLFATNRREFRLRVSEAGEVQEVKE